MSTLKILCIFPICLIGYVIGFVFESLNIGIVAGRDSVEKLAVKCYNELTAKKQKKEGKK
jgi:hypothetical protein